MNYTPEFQRWIAKFLYAPEDKILLYYTRRGRVYNLFVLKNEKRAMKKYRLEKPELESIVLKINALMILYELLLLAFPHQKQ